MCSNCPIDSLDLMYSGAIDASLMLPLLQAIPQIDKLFKITFDNDKLVELEKNIPEHILRILRMF